MRLCHLPNAIMHLTLSHPASCFLPLCLLIFSKWKLAIIQLQFCIHLPYTLLPAIWYSANCSFPNEILQTTDFNLAFSFLWVCFLQNGILQLERKQNRVLAQIPFHEEFALLQNSVWCRICLGVESGLVQNTISYYNWPIYMHYQWVGWLLSWQGHVW